MKKSMIILQAAAILLLAGCAKNESPAIEEGPFENTVTVVNADVPGIVFDEDSRSSFNSAGVFSWSANDKIGFWPDASGVKYADEIKQAIFYTPSSSSGKTAFKANGWGIVHGKKYYSYYPYDEQATPSSVVIDYSGQKQASNNDMSHLGVKDFLHSSVTVSEEGAADLVYSHLGCIAKFILTVPDDCASSQFSTMEIEAPSSILVPTAEYNPSVDDVTLQKHTAQSLSMELADFKCNTDKQIIVYMMMSPVAWQGKEISVCLTDTQGTELTGKFTPTKNQTAGAGKTYRASLAGGKVGDYTDLSASGAANCYIVNKTGKYCFKAVRGNDKSDVVAGVRAADIWTEFTSEDGKTIIKGGDNVKYDGKYVYFETTDTYHTGSVALAVLDDNGGHGGYEEDINGHVLWSWHIWFTGNGVTPGTVVHGSHTFMDRNLGAHNATDGGFLYQWGRKDPFMMSQMTTNPDNTIPTGGQPGTQTIDWANRHPQKFIYGTASDRHWCSESSKKLTLWGHGSDKTKYDPCPAGYRVPENFDCFASSKPSWPTPGVRGMELDTYKPYGETSGYMAYWTNEATASGAPGEVVPEGKYVGICMEKNNHQHGSYCVTAQSIRCEKIQ